MFEIDACGLACPEPLVLLKNALLTNNSVLIKVDSPLAKENCILFINNANYRYTVVHDKSIYCITVTK